MVDDYLTTHGTSRSRLKKLYGILITRANKPEAPLVVSDDLIPRLSGLRDLFTKKIQTLQRDLPTDHPVKMPFGLLGDLSIAQLHETTHTKMLAWLLDPSKPHGFGAAFLCSLINEAGADIREVIEVQVHTEYHLPPKLGRIDIFATGSTTGPTPEPWGLWIEAKTKWGTQEGSGQLKRYERHRLKWRQETGGQDYGIFLTPDGRQTRSTDNHLQWQSLSYIRLATIFWREAEKHRHTLRFEWLRLYVSSIIQAYGNIHWESLDTLPYFQLLELENSL